MSNSEIKRNRPKPIPIRDRSEARANRSYIIVPETPPAPARPVRRQEAPDGEAV